MKIGWHFIIIEIAAVANDIPVLMLSDFLFDFWDHDYILIECWYEKF